MNPAARRLDPATTTLAVVDVQERLMAAMSDAARTEASVVRLVRAAALLDVPVVASEQYPKGLGRTVPAVAEALPADAARVEKTVFSAVREPAFARAIGDGRNVVIAGVESHVCVLQTALDLLAAGRAVHVVADAVDSRTPANRAAGLERLRAAGATMATTEMVLFELVRGADHPRFRDVQALVK